MPSGTDRRPTGAHPRKRERSSRESVAHSQEVEGQLTPALSLQKPRRPVPLTALLWSIQLLAVPTWPLPTWTGNSAGWAQHTAGRVRVAARLQTLGSPAWDVEPHEPPGSPHGLGPRAEGMLTEASQSRWKSTLRYALMPSTAPGSVTPRRSSAKRTTYGMVAVTHTTWGEHSVTGPHRPPAGVAGHRVTLMACAQRGGPRIGKPGLPNSHRTPAQQTPPGARLSSAFYPVHCLSQGLK